VIFVYAILLSLTAFIIIIELHICISAFFLVINREHFLPHLDIKTEEQEKKPRCFVAALAPSVQSSNDNQWRRQ
jgi:hypothetical protein